jgi:hypothetical protein
MTILFPKYRPIIYRIAAARVDVNQPQNCCVRNMEHNGFDNVSAVGRKAIPRRMARRKNVTMRKPPLAGSIIA